MMETCTNAAQTTDCELVSSRAPLGRDFSDCLQQQLRQVGLSVTEICTQADITRETWYQPDAG